jgi:hypothetical protein
MPKQCKRKQTEDSDLRGDCVASACAGAGCLSWGFAALRGLEPSDVERSWVPPRPFGVRRPSGLPSDSRPPGRSRREAHLALSRPFRGHLHESARPFIGPATCVAIPTSGTCFLSWTSITLRHMPAWWTRMSAADPSATACRVEVWLPPSRRSPPGLATLDAFRRHTPAGAQCAPEHPWASPYKGFPSTAIGAPLGVLCPPAVAPPVLPPPEGVGGRCGAVFRAFVPRRVRADTDARRASPPARRPPIPSWDFASPELEPT